jgi:hypothetical protein
MNQYLDEHLEDYVLGLIPQQEALLIEQRLPTDLVLRKQIHDLRVVRETIARSQAKASVSALKQRQHSQPQPLMRPLYKYAATGVAAAASVVFLMLSSPIQSTFDEALNQRGYTVGMSADAQKRLDTFKKAQVCLDKGNASLAITLLEPLCQSTQINEMQSYYRSASKWMLAVAYMKINKPYQSEHILNQLDSSVETPAFNKADKWKLRWQIFWKKLWI